MDRVGACIVLAALSNRPVPLADEAVSNLLMAEAVILPAVLNRLPELVVLSDRNEGMLGIEDRGGTPGSGRLGETDLVEPEEVDAMV